MFLCAVVAGRRILAGWSLITESLAYEIYRHSRRANTQPAQPRFKAAARQTNRLHGPVRIGQVFARLRYNLCRGSTPLRRVAVGLRTSVPVSDGKAGRRPHRRPVSGDFHRTEIDIAQSAFNRRHGHRDLRLPAPPVCACRHAALPRSRHHARSPNRRPDGGFGARTTRGHAPDAACTHCLRTQG